MRTDFIPVEYNKFNFSTGSNCCFESSGQHCYRNRRPDTSCSQLWCVVPFPSPSHTPKGENQQGMCSFANGESHLLFTSYLLITVEESWTTANIQAAKASLWQLSIFEYH